MSPFGGAERSATLPAGEGRLGGPIARPSLRGLHLLTAAAFASRDVGVHRLVLPAEFPLVVDRELGPASRRRTGAVGLVALVGPRARPDRLASVPLLRHLVHVPSWLSPEDGRVLRPRRVFERCDGAVHSWVSA